jgi:hypothetical protein
MRRIVIKAARPDVIRFSRDENPVDEAPREWLVTKGLGGFASAIVSSQLTRRYHGYLIAALPAPLGRVVMLNDLHCDIEQADGSVLDLQQDGKFGLHPRYGLAKLEL